MDYNIFCWLEYHSANTPQCVALKEAEWSFSFSELKGRCDKLAAWMYENGVRPGDRVGCLLNNGHRFVEILFASARIGAVFSPVNVFLPKDELAGLLVNLKPSLIFADCDLVELPAARSLGLFIRCSSSCMGEDDYELNLQNHYAVPEMLNMAAHSLQAIIHTSGTTGKPKPVQLTSGNLLWNALQLLGRFPLGLGHKVLTMSPMFHIGGLGGLTLPAIYSGASVYLLPKFDAELALDVIERESVTCAFGLPSMWLAISQSNSELKRDLSSVSFFMSGGAACPLTVIDYFQQHGIQLIQRYGLTEAAPIVCLLSAVDARRKHGSVGTPPMHMTLRVVDPNGEDVCPGEIGELLCKGPNVSPGYWGLDVLTGETFRDGWLHTGDLAYMDSDGFVFIVDRVLDSIYGQEHAFFPNKVEQVLHRAAGVLNAAVVGVSDYEGGVTVSAFIVEKVGETVSEDDLRRLCATSLEPHERPGGYFFVDTLPKSGSGKVLRRVLREQLQ